MPDCEPDQGSVASGGQWTAAEAAMQLEEQGRPLEGGQRLNGHR